MTTIKSKDRDYTGEHYEGNFDCFSKNIESLEGAPKSVGGIFDCDNNDLESLEGAPISVGRSFNCDGNNLTSLKGAPVIVGGNFYCYNNKLESLEGAPKSVGSGFNCTRYLLKGENLYIIANALLNGRKDRVNFEESVLYVLTDYFI